MSQKKLYQIYNEDTGEYKEIRANDEEGAAEEYAEYYFEKEFETDQEVEIEIKVIELHNNEERILKEEFENEGIEDNVYTFNMWWECRRSVFVRKE